MTASERIKLEYLEESYVAEYLGYTLNSLRTLHSSGKDLPIRVKVGKRRLYPAKDFQAWLSRRKAVRPVA